MSSIKTILATMYAVHPTKGSEDAMGWNYVLQIARFQKVYAVTRQNNKTAIDEYISENPSPIFDNITFLYYDLPYWMRFWKKGSRGALLYYWMWQKGLPNFVRKQSIEYDIVHNVTFPNDWTPSYLWKLNKPFVWGPIGHHPRIPKQYFKYYTFKHKLKDKLTWLVKNYFWKISPDLNRTVSNADFIYAMNSSVTTKINLESKRHLIAPSVATQDFGFELAPPENRFNIISAGRFVALKGFDLTVHAFAKFVSNLPEKTRSSCSLTLVGKGPEKILIDRLIIDLGISKYVKIVSWVERESLMQMMKSSSVFLFGSHEGAGMVVAEALSFGLPVICLDNCGPGEFITEQCGFKIKESAYDETITEMANGLATLFQNTSLQQQMRIEARRRFENTFHWDRRGEWLREIYDEVV